MLKLTYLPRVMENEYNYVGECIEQFGVQAGNDRFTAQLATFTTTPKNLSRSVDNGIPHAFENRFYTILMAHGLRFAALKALTVSIKDWTR